jgi:hypothetical protein
VDLELLVHSQASPVMWQIMPVYDQWGLVGELVDDVSRHLEPTDGPLIADRGLLVQLLPWSVVSRSACYDWMAHLQCVRERVLGW